MTLRWCSCVTFVLLNLILETTDGSAAPKSDSKTCVIGAGYSGLGVARYLQEYGVNYIVLEATRHVGGTWRFDPHVGMDEDGLPLFTSMYKYLRTNTPRQTMEYAEFPFPESTPTYPTGACFYKYLKLFAKKFDIEKNIQFRSLVTSVVWSADHWLVTYMRTDTRASHTEHCDYVVVASGELTKPVVPHFEGMELFKGTMIHSHDYKEPEPYKNRRVLLIGAGPSGLDLATHLTNVTAKLVHSHHLKYNAPNFGEPYVKRPDIKQFTASGVVFQDGSYEDVDDVIFCTGYDFDHPFLDDKSIGITKSGKFILPLYQHTVNIRHPTMMFIGIPKKIINKVMDAQGEYVAALIAKKFKLPPQEEMLKNWLDHVYSLQKKRMKIVDVNVVGNQMDQFFANLTKEAGVRRVAPVLTEIRDFNAVIRLDDLLHYRDYDFKVIDDEHYVRGYNPRSGNTCPIDI